MASVIMTVDIIRVAGRRLLPSYDNIETWSGYLDYDFCCHIILYTHYLCSWIMTSVVKWQHRDMIRVSGLWLLSSWQYRHYPGSWMMTSAVILYYTPIICVAGLWLLSSNDSIDMIRVAGWWLLLSYDSIGMIRVAGLRLLQSYYTIHPLSG